MDNVHSKIVYSFAGVECAPYTKAKLEMTPDEIERLTEVLQGTKAHTNKGCFLQHQGKTKVIVDTDLGYAVQS